jgi:hypothetical protein
MVLHYAAKCRINSNNTVFFYLYLKRFLKIFLKTRGRKSRETAPLRHPSEERKLGIFDRYSRA